MLHILKYLQIILVAFLPCSPKVPGSIVSSDYCLSVVLHGFSMSVWVSSGFSGFLCVHGARVYSHSSRSTVTLTWTIHRIENYWEMNASF